MFMKYLKLSVATLLGAVSLNASALTVLGVTWDENAATDFSAFSLAIRQQILDTTTGVISGYGVVNSINSAAVGCAGCEITFQFGGFTPISGGVIPGANTSILYAGGFLKVYVDFTPEVDPFNAQSLTFANTGDGDLFLSLTGHNLLTGNSFTGVSSQGTLSGQGYLDVVGGAAAVFFNTNTQLQGADATLTSSFTSFIPAGNLTNAFGTGNLFSDSVAVPVPGVVALLGLGLVGLARRRKA
jgi:uncharacterized protein (TIGR03382 family)